MRRMRTQIRQGDVLLIPREAPREDGLIRAVDSDGQPLAGVRIAGERTGHAHELAGRVYDYGTERLVMLERPGVLTHQEHAHQPVEAGWWEVRVQRELVARFQRNRWD